MFGYINEAIDYLSKKLFDETDPANGIFSVDFFK